MVQIPRDQLKVVFNALADTDRSRIAVEHPGDDLGELFTIHLADAGQARIEFTCSIDEYRERRSTVNEQYGEPAITEVPGANSYVNAFFAAGVLPIPNQSELNEFLDRHGSPDLTAGHRPVFAGFDTNVLPWHVADVLGFAPGQDAVVNGYALATGVRDELVWKHKRNDTRSLEEAFGDEFDELWNQPRGPDREGRLGETYYRQLRDQRYADEFTTETGDEAIVDGYDDYQQDSGKEVLLFSNDRDFVERARSQRVLAHRVELPSSLPDEVIAPTNQVGNALYHLTVLFGVLELPGITAYGVWKGKGGTAWQDQLLKLDCRSPKLRGNVERDLEIIRAHRDVSERPE